MCNYKNSSFNEMKYPDWSNTCSKQAERRVVIQMNQARKNWSEDAAGDFFFSLRGFCGL